MMARRPCLDIHRKPYLTPSGIPSGAFFPVGKRMGDVVYVHRSALGTMPDDVQAYVRARHEVAQEPDFDVVKYSPKLGNVTFITTDDWDGNPEPMLVATVLVRADGSVHAEDVAHKQLIYHRKWEFVAPDYPGFDWRASRARTEYYEQHPYIIDLKKNGVDGKMFSSLIGRYPFWKQYVLDVIFPHESGRRRCGMPWPGSARRPIHRAIRSAPRSRARPGQSGAPGPSGR
jgi:hypothetical protein